jgi:hypothetical protein
MLTQNSACCLRLDGYLFGLLFYPEDGGNKLPWNVDELDLHGVASNKTMPFIKYC